MKLSKAEEQVMKYLWKLEKAFMKDLIHSFPEPKPANTTVSTLISRMIDKGFVGYHQYGKVREYYPLVEKSDYFTSYLKGLIHNFFNNSNTQFASFFATEVNLSIKELEELQKIVAKQLNSKKSKNVK